MRNFSEYTDMEVSILVEEMQAGKVDYSLDDLKDCQAEIVNRRLNSRYASIISDLMMDKLMNKADNDTTEDSDFFIPPTAEQTAEQIEEVIRETEPEPEATTHSPPPVIPAIPSNTTTHDDDYNSFHEEADEVEPEIPMTNYLHNKMHDLYYEAPVKKASPVIKENDYPVFHFLTVLLTVLPWLAMVCIYAIFGYNALYGSFKGDLAFLIYGGISSIVLSFVILLVCLGIKENLIWKIKVAKKLGIK